LCRVAFPCLEGIAPVLRVSLAMSKYEPPSDHRDKASHVGSCKAGDGVPSLYNPDIDGLLHSRAALPVDLEFLCD